MDTWGLGIGEKGYGGRVGKSLAGLFMGWISWLD